MSALYEYEADYLPNIPEYVQDLISVHNFRFYLQPHERPMFDWWTQYVLDNPHEESYPHPKPILIED